MAVINAAAKQLTPNTTKEIERGAGLSKTTFYTQFGRPRQ